MTSRDYIRTKSDATLPASAPNPHNQTLTVGLGITPSLLSLLPAQQAPAGYTLFVTRDYRRWGLSPRPENPPKGKDLRLLEFFSLNKLVIALRVPLTDINTSL